ncbi:MAG: DUF4177 domain-containing protein [Candidatus Levyibacteriota bacterium]|nr:MAG: DUF4177 domain-containing protein [Candidatus Levybacteria bacterium]
MFEYKIVLIDASTSDTFLEKVQNELNKYGAEGWELVTIESFSNAQSALFYGGGKTSGFVAILKRKKESK